MSDLIKEADDLSRRLDRFLFDINEGMRRSLHGVAGATPLKFSLNMRDTHFAQRVIERDIDKGQIGSVFKILIERYLCELLYLTHTPPQHNRDYTRIVIRYKDVIIILRFKASFLVDNLPECRIFLATVMPRGYLVSEHEYEMILESTDGH